MKRIFNILWLPTAIFIFNALPWIQHLTDTVWWFDDFMHIFGGFSIAYMFIAILKNYTCTWWKQIPFMWKIIFVIAFVFLFGVAWEWYEFLHDQIFGTHYQPSLYDTMTDLLYDFIGALIFLCLPFKTTNRT